jgi:hypothetical protein
MRLSMKLFVALGVTLANATFANAQTKDRTVARLFWQDASDQSLKSGDLKRGDAWKMEPSTVNGFPELDPNKQAHVQMQHAGGIVLTGIHDTEDGEFQSGWVAIDSGVTEDTHGDHSHWHFGAAPKVVASRIDDQQGNPAHVYLYGGAFYLANDKKNGFTIVTPSAFHAKGGGKRGTQSSASPRADHFISAGGGHITLAAVNSQVAYATWIDREGENMGRVDVVGFGGNTGRRYHFHLPSGGLHGATTNSGKVFFAPSDGVCWVTADTSLSQKVSEVDVHHISLGEDEEGNPKRTGAFANAGNHVLFTIGRGANPELCMLNAASPKPALIKLPLNLAEGNTITTPRAVQSRTGESFAFLFEESRGGDQPEQLHVVALDPNRDGSYADATLRSSLTVGRSLIEGHSGHHEATAIGRSFVAFSNPGDGTITIVSTSDWTVQATLQVGGTPTRIIAVGG